MLLFMEPLSHIPHTDTSGQRLAAALHNRFKYCDWQTFLICLEYKTNPKSDASLIKYQELAIVQQNNGCLIRRLHSCFE